jgi:hypothetical protein
MESYPLNATNKTNENKTIHQILRANKYYQNINLKKQVQRPNLNNQTNTQINKKRAIFTYTGSKTRAVTKIFQKAGIKIAFTTKHTICKLLRQQNDSNDKFDNSGVYQLQCSDCGKQYIGHRLADLLKPVLENTKETMTQVQLNHYMPSTF